MQAVTKSCVAAAGTYCGIGFEVPIAPTLVALFAVVMVRILVWTKGKTLLWNIAVCGLAMLAAFATVEGSSLSVFKSFWIGVGYGALGVGIVELGKGILTKALTERLSAAGAALFNIPLKPSNDETNSESEDK